MAAICGVLRFDGAPVADALAARIAGRMLHRSPDGVRIQQAGVLALGFGALHATPEAALEALPLQLPDGGWLVVDGSVHDRPALAHALGLAPPQLAGSSDARLLALAWLRWREELWRHAAAEYALAAWEPAHARLSLLRDRVGMRPLYIARTPTMLGFASEAEPLLGIDGVSAEPDPHRLASNLAPAFDDGDRGATLYRDVRRVLPGEIVEVNGTGKLLHRRYFAFTPLDPLRLRTHGDYVEAFRATFDAAVRSCLRGGAAPSLMLSGGIDSASVHASALAQGLPLRRVSVVAQQPGAEAECANIEALLAQTADRLHIHVDGTGSGIDIPGLVAEVFGHPHPVRNSIVLPMLVGQAAAASGSRALLDGIDGDLAMWSPNNYVGRMALAGHPLAAWREARAAARHHTRLHHLPAWKILGRSLASRLEPEWLACRRYRLVDHRRGDAPFLGLLRPDIVRRLELRERTLALHTALRRDRPLRGSAAYRAWLWANPGFMRGGEGFDLAAARFGLEARHPWCDPRVVDLMSRLPMDVVVRDGWTKHVAREAFTPELGEVAWHSGKRHLGAQVIRCLLDAGRAWVDAALADEAGVLDPWLDPQGLADVRAGWAAGTADPASNERVLDVATLQGWLVGLEHLAAGDPE